MESSTIIIYLSLSLLFLLLSFKLTRRRGNLPPGPPSLPIIGNLHLLKPPLYRLYHRLSHQYGPIFSLRFGSRLVVVVSSATLAQECFTTNDIVLANRPKSIAGKHMGYNSTTFSFASYGDHWRNLRRIGAVEIFSSARLNAFLAIRSDEVRRLVLRLSEGSETQLAMVELKPMLVDLTFNNIMRMMAGKRYDGNDDVAKKLKELISEAFRGRGLPNPRDFIPILNLFGEGSSEKMVKNLAKNLDGVMQKLVDEHRQGERKNTMIDHLLSLQQTEPDYYTDQIIKGLVLAFMLAGTDTSAVTLEWAMANLLNHPQAMQKLRAELDEQIGQERVLEEQDLSKLPYLENVIWETLRLYPATPLLLPHMASADCRIGGYDVPCGTMVVVNAWAIHRDPEVWEDADTFKPERFETEQRESHKLLPFGSGRRACPGSGLALRVMALALGSMVQCFDWERVGEDEIDMSEALGTTMPKARPLEALCRARPAAHKHFYNHKVTLKPQILLNQ